MARRSAHSPRTASCFRLLGLGALVGLLAAPAAAAEGGLEIFPDERMLVLILLFLALIFPLDRLLFRPLLRTLEERDARIAGTRKRADEIAGKADVALDRYQSAVTGARGSAEDARREQLDAARREESQLTAAARASAEEQLGEAVREVGASLDAARAQLRGEAEALAREAASRVLGRALS